MAANTPPDEKVREYLARAMFARELAEQATLQNQKDLHIRSAERWEARASQQERTLRQKAVNDSSGKQPVSTWPDPKDYP